MKALMLRNSGRSTSGDKVAVRFVGPMAPATQRGLPAEAALGGEAVGLAQTDPDMPDFAPLDAEFVDDASDFWEN